MCGILGTYNFLTRKKTSAETLKHGLMKMHHRGPDSLGTFAQNEVSLGMVRLSIIDLTAPCGPLRSSSGRFSIVFNGEIFNYKELKKDIGSRYPFQTDTDTEVVLALYDLFDLEPEKKLRGMYAYAIFDHLKQEVILCRDRMGEKPLFYGLTRDGVIFGSEVKAFFSFPEFKAAPNLQAMSDFLSLGYLPSDQSAFDGVLSVPAASTLTIGPTGIQGIKQYWNLPILSENEKLDSAYASSYTKTLDALDQAFDEAVKYRMVSDVPISVFLSGGIDSSLVLSYATKHSSDLNAYTLGFSSKYDDEVETASEIAKHFNIPHRSIDFDYSKFKNVFEPCVAQADNLLANPAMFANYILSSEAGSHRKIALHGGGGDELFYGYPTYRADWIKKMFFPGIIGKTTSRLKWGTGFIPAEMKGIGFQYKLFKFLEGVGLPQHQAHYWWRTILDRRDKNNLSPVFQNCHDAFDSIRQEISTFDRADIFEQFSFTDLAIWWKNMGLYQGDIMSMAHGLELRVPMMDHPFVEFVAGIPRKFKFSPSRTKPLLRDLAKRSLPKSIVKLKKKGFHIPLNEWFANPSDPFLNDKLSPDRMRLLGFNPQAVERLIIDHRARKFDNSYKLINLMVLSEWYLKYFPTHELGELHE